MGYLAELRDQRRQDQWAASQIRQSEQDAIAQRRRENRAAAEQRARARAEQRRLARGRFVRRMPDLGMSMLWATMIVLPISLAWQAQALFAADTLHIPAPWNHAFPAAVECAAWLCAFEAHRRIRQGLSAGLLPTYMWVLAGTAAAINGAHGLRDGGPVAGLALAVLSLLGVFLHAIRQGLDQARVSGTGHVRLAWWRRVRYPRLSVAAASLRAARDGLTPGQAWQLAWVDRYGVGPDTARRERDLARRALRRAAVENRKAVRAGDVMVLNGRVQYGFARIVREHVDRERDTALAQAQAIVQGAQDALSAAGLLFGPDVLTHGFGPHATPVNPADEQGGRSVAPLSPRATELLPALREAIEQGAVRPNPSVRVIEKWVRNDLQGTLGTPVAMELRDQVRDLRAVPATATDQTTGTNDTAGAGKEVVA